MKKTLQMFCLLVLLILFGCFIFSVQNRNVQFKIMDGHTLVLYLKTNDGDEILYPWVDEPSGVLYFFMPSFANKDKIYCDYINEGELTINEKELSGNDRFEWKSQTPYSVTLNNQNYEVVFMKSENLPSLFLVTESGNMDRLNADKSHEETGSIQLIQTSGNIEYQGTLEKVSARGNSTFATDKKAYTFTLNKKSTLCGLDAGKKWNLLALHYENNKMQSKLIYDMANYIGLEYTPGSTWVDLYCNGKYQGLYLLTEAITVGEGRVNIYDLGKEHENNSYPSDVSGGYLLEREVTESLEPLEVYFTTERCNYNFVLKSPKFPTRREFNFIKEYTQNIENLLTSGDASYKNYLDLDSFSKQFLIDKLVLNPDAMRSSTFYYKDKNSDVLKAGPLWDYDRAMGVSLPNYQLQIGDYPDTMNDWYVPLYKDEEFYNILINNYKSLLPYLEDLLNYKIDAYAEMLAPSVAMDTTMWPFNSTYTEYDNYIKYLKYFLTNRIIFLNGLWGMSEFDYELSVETDELHTVRFFDTSNTLTKTCQVKDGECILTLSDLDTEMFEWCYQKTGSVYDVMHPIYEDTDIYAEARFATYEEYIAYKLDKIKHEDILENYLTLLRDTDFSVCIYLPAGSELFYNETLLNAVEDLSTYQTPKLLETSKEAAADYMLVIDNSWEHIWESTNGEEINDLTTFGSLQYTISDNGISHLYIQENGIDYLASETKDIAVQFVVIDKATGSIEDTAAFTMSERIKLQ